MKRINKLILFCVLIIGSLINVKSAKAYTFNISTIPCTNNQGCNATGCGYYGQTTYFNLWDASVSNTMKSVTLSIYKDGNYDIGDSRSANNDYMNWTNMGFTFYNTGRYTYHFDGTDKDGSTFYGDGDFYIYDIAPSISSSPYARSVKLGTSSTFSVSVSKGSHLSYQWGYNYDGSTSTWHLIDGATSSSYTISASDMTASCNGRYYFCRVSNYGNDNVFSTPAKLTVYSTISYNSNGGMGAPSSVNKNCDTSVTISSQKPTREGYEFLGWSTSSVATSANSSYAPGSIYSANENITLYAVWKQKTYAIIYYANGGKNAPDSQIKNHGTSIYLSNSKPTREGYEFLGWSTSSTANSANSSYAPGSTYNTNANLSLYAVWKQVNNATPSPVVTSAPPKTAAPTATVTIAPIPTARVTIAPTPTARVTVAPVPTVPVTSAPVPTIPVITAPVTTNAPSKTAFAQQTSKSSPQNTSTSLPVKSSNAARLTVSGLKAVSSYVKQSGFCYRKVVNLSWNKSPKADGFYVYRKEGASSEKKIADVPMGDAINYTDRSVKTGETYTYRILPYTETDDGEKTAGNFSGKQTLRIDDSLKLPKASASTKGKHMTLSFQQAEGKYYETQYSWNGKKWKNQSRMKGKLQKKIVKKIKAKGFFLRVRSYDIVNGKKIYSKWSAGLKVK